MTTAAAHPLDPLSATEISQVRELLGRDRGVGERWRWASIELLEPAKDAVLTYQPGQPIERRARAVVWNRADGEAYAVVAGRVCTKQCGRLDRWSRPVGLGAGRGGRNAPRAGPQPRRRLEFPIDRLVAGERATARHGGRARAAEAGAERGTANASR